MLIICYKVKVMYNLKKNSNKKLHQLFFLYLLINAFEHVI